MRRKRLSTHGVLLYSIAVFLASCGPAPTPTSVAVVPTDTPAPAATSAPTFTPALTSPSAPDNSGGPRGVVDLGPFKEMARAGGCADIRNRLFLIDDQLVFWDTAGNCADAAYGQALYGSTPDQVLCVYHDSIAGPVRNCQDERYQDTFDTIAANLDKPDLGLGPGHTVQSVAF